MALTVTDLSKALNTSSQSLVVLMVCVQSCRSLEYFLHTGTVESTDDYQVVDALM